MQIDFLGLQAFLAIVELGSFQRAADQLNLTQTAVSHRLRKLEQSLGIRLIARTTRAVRLTDAGLELLPKARAAVRDLQLSFETLRAHGASAPRWLSVACLPTIAAHQLAPVLERFAPIHPDIDVRVFDTSIAEIAELVQSDAVEFGLTVETANRWTLAAQAIAEEAFVLVCPVQHRLADASAVRWKELRDEPMIRISLPSGNSATIEEALSEHHQRLRWRYEVQRTAIALSLVKAGIGLTVVPRLSVGPESGVVVRELIEPAVTRRLQFLTRGNARLSAPAQVFRDLLAMQLAKALGGGECGS